MRSNLLLALAPLVLVACDVDAADDASTPDAGASSLVAEQPPPAAPAKHTPLFWDTNCLHNQSISQIQIGDINKPKYLSYTWGGATYVTTSSSVLYGVDVNAYDPGCTDGFLLDVLGSNQQFGVVVTYQDALPTNADACSQTSIWVSGYTYGQYIGAYADYLNFVSRWTRYDQYGHPLPISLQSPHSGTRYALSDVTYAHWENGKCTIRPLELIYRHPDYPYGQFYPWYRLVIGGFRGTSSTSYADKAKIQVQIGLDSAVPGCKPSYYCQQWPPPGINNPDPPPSSWSTFETLTCADGAKNTGITASGSCSAPPPPVSASDVVGLGLLILGLLLF